MCSILGIFRLGAKDDLRSLRAEAIERSRRQRHRGPDWTGVHADGSVILVHERLATIDLDGGRQPLRSADGNMVLAVNGEIYNHRELQQQLSQPYEFLTHSDCEIILALYREDPTASFLRRLNGMFAFALHDSTNHRVVIGRDPLGLCPLYWGEDRRGLLWIASEMKALVGMCKSLTAFPPGHFFSSHSDRLVDFGSGPWHCGPSSPRTPPSVESLHETLTSAVQRQSMSDVACDVLLSERMETWLLAAYATRTTHRRVGKTTAEELGRSRLKSFSVGCEGFDDLAIAASAAAMLGTNHRAFSFTLDEAIDALPEVIWHIESWDVTTVRAAIPLYLLARRIKALGSRVVLVWQGAETPPNDGARIDRLSLPQALQRVDHTRSAAIDQDPSPLNKAMMAWGVEARMPFLDLEFMDSIDRRAARTASPASAFRELCELLLPPALRPLLDRQRDQRRDWAEGLTSHAEATLTDKEFATRCAAVTAARPQSKEAMIYRDIFERYFSDDANPGESQPIAYRLR